MKEVLQWEKWEIGLKNIIQLRISLKDKMPNIRITYKTTILTNFKAKPTVTIAHKDDAITVTVRRQPRQRYIQPNVSGTVTAKENK